jgi:hypothetical protein
MIKFFKSILMAKGQNAEKQTPELKQLIKVTNELEGIKHQFGYQGSSNPICVKVCELIDENKKIIEAHGK